MAIAQATAVAMGALHPDQHPAMVSNRCLLGTEFSKSTAVRNVGGFVARKRLVLTEPEGLRRVDFRVRAFETTLTPQAPEAAPEKKSLGDITKGDFPILNQVLCRFFCHLKAIN
jgi:hypothetical protein